MPDSINLHNELIKERRGSKRFIGDILSIIEKEQSTYLSIEERLHSKGRSQLSATPLPLERIFHISDLRKVALTYRLRFLDLKFFTPPLPHQAKKAIKDIESEYRSTLKGFKILAPESAFCLKDEHDDPILVAQLTEDTYLEVYTWGNDLAWHRKLSSYFLRNGISFGLFLVLLGLSLGTSLGLILHETILGSSSLLFLIYFWSLAITLSMGSLTWFISRKAFSADSWDQVFH